MPNPKQRKVNLVAKQRILDKYLRVDNRKHPHRFFPPLKEDTFNFRKMMDTKNYVRIMTQLDSNKYVMIQYYVFCDDDIWMCGDSMVLNQNPDKKILAQCLCVLNRKQCLAYDENSHEFLTVCAKCGKVGVAVKGTAWKCKNCGFIVHNSLINSAPYISCNCEFCPAEIGWDKLQALENEDNGFYRKFLRVRKDDMYFALNEKSEDQSIQDFVLDKILKKEGRPCQ